jgi:hypothetical protein
VAVSRCIRQPELEYICIEWMEMHVFLVKKKNTTVLKEFLDARNVQILFSRMGKNYIIYTVGTCMID